MEKKLGEIYMQAIWDVTDALQDEKQLENSLSLCLEILKRATGAEGGFIWLKSQKDDKLHCIASSARFDLTGTGIDSDRGIPGTVYRSKKIILSNTGIRDEVYIASADPGTDTVIENTLAIPMATRTASYGTLQLINKDQGFTEADQTLCGNLAALISIDIEDKGYVISDKEEKQPMIVLTDVSKEYQSGDKKVRILKGINLTIYEQEFLVILGESGCGKTTLLNIIGGMDSMTDGTMTVEGKDFSHPSEKELTKYRRDYLGFVFQSYNLMPNLSAIENVEFIAENSSSPISSEEAIEMVSLSNRKNNRPSQMSGGQQQRVSIARALVKNPKLIIADEPTAALDCETSKEVLEIVEKIVRQEKKTVVMVTHNTEISKMADRVVRIRDGEISSIRINSTRLSASELSW